MDNKLVNCTVCGWSGSESEAVVDIDTQELVCPICDDHNFNTKMNERFKELAVEAKIQMVSEPRLQEFAELIIKDVINTIETNPARRHCAFTTYDLGIVECTVQNAINAIRTHYDVKEIFGIK